MPNTAESRPNYEVNSPVWAALQVVSENIARNLVTGRRELLFNLSNWRMTIDLFKEFEEQRLVLREGTPQDYEFHRITLSQLLSSGEKLLGVIETAGQ